MTLYYGCCFPLLWPMFRFHSHMVTRFEQRQLSGTVVVIMVLLLVLSFLKVSLFLGRYMSQVSVDRLPLVRWSLACGACRAEMETSLSLGWGWLCSLEALCSCSRFSSTGTSLFNCSFCFPVCLGVLGADQDVFKVTAFSKVCGLLACILDTAVCYEPSWDSVPPKMLF